MAPGSANAICVMMPMPAIKAAAPFNPSTTALSSCFLADNWTEACLCCKLGANATEGDAAARARNAVSLVEELGAMVQIESIVQTIL